MLMLRWTGLERSSKEEEEKELRQTRRGGGRRRNREDLEIDLEVGRS